MQKQAGEGGFTLIELMVAVAVAAVLLAAALPSMRTLIQNERASTQLNTLILSLNYARSEAIKRDLPTGIVVCPSVDQLTCSGTSAWNQGWIVRGPAAEPALQSALPLSGANTLSEASNLTAITFMPNGLVSAAAVFTLCDSRGAAHARDIEVSASGRIVSSPTQGRSLAGAALSCP